MEGFRRTSEGWRRVLASLVRAEVGDGPSDEDVNAVAALMLAIYNGLILHATLEGDELDLDRIMHFQQVGLDGIFASMTGQDPKPEGAEAPKKP